MVTSKPLITYATVPLPTKFEECSVNLLLFCHLGLGPEGTGRKYPVKTILKQDRSGLGSKNKEKAKITHFSACDTSAVENTNDRKLSGGLRVPRRTWKKKLVQKQKEDRKWEHNLRVYMNTE